MQAEEKPGAGRDPARVAVVPAGLSNTLAKPDVAGNHDLLDALPIAAAVVGLTSRGKQ